MVATEEHDERTSVGDILAELVAAGKVRLFTRDPQLVHLLVIDATVRFEYLSVDIRRRAGGTFHLTFSIRKEDADN